MPVEMFTIYVDSYGEQGYLFENVDLKGDVNIAFVPIDGFDARDIYACFTKGKARIVLEQVRTIVHSLNGSECGTFEIRSLHLSPAEVRMISQKQFKV